MVTLPDGRAVPPPCGEERAMLVSWLDFHRATLELKCTGLSEEQLRNASVPPSRVTLLGLLQHMAEVERNWFRRMFAGQDVPPVSGGDGFDVPPDRDADTVLAAWRAEVAAAGEVIAEASLTDVVTPLMPEASFLGEKVSLRWILMHMIEEYARHNGHADLIRERIDGTTGV